jgi:hypothetical protein
MLALALLGGVVRKSWLLNCLKICTWLDFLKTIKQFKLCFHNEVQMQSGFL